MPFDEPQDLDDRFRSLTEEGPSSDFVERLRRDVLAAAGEFEADDVLVVKIDPTEVADRSGSHGTRRWLAVAAVVVVVTGLVGSLALTGGDTVATDPAPPSPPTLEQELLELLQRISDGDPSAGLELGERLDRADALLVATEATLDTSTLALTADGSRLVLSELQGVRSVDLRTGEATQVSSITNPTTGESFAARDVLLSPDGRLSYGGSGNGQGRIQPINGFELVDVGGDAWPLPVLDDAPAERVLSIANNLLFFADAQGEPQQLVNVRGLQIQPSQANTLRMAPDASLVVADRGATFGTPAGIAVWPVDSDGLDPSHPLIEAGVGLARHVAFSPGGEDVAAFTGDAIVVFDIETWAPIVRIERTDVVGLVYVDDRHLLSLGSGEAQIWDLELGEPAGFSIPWQPIPGRADNAVPRIAVAPDAGTVAVISADDAQVIEVWATTQTAWVAVACDLLALSQPGEELQPVGCR